MKEVKLTLEEQQVLRKLTKEQLQFLSRLAKDKDFNVLTDIVNYFIEQEKNIFFGEKEITPDQLFVSHAFARGGIAKIVMFVHIIVGAQRELDKREEKRKNA